MKAFLMTLLVSVVASIVFWNFGLARLIWPAHPLLATTILATICGIITQVVYSEPKTPAAQGSKRAGR